MVFLLSLSLVPFPGWVSVFSLYVRPHFSGYSLEHARREAPRGSVSPCPQERRSSLPGNS